MVGGPDEGTSFAEELAALKRRGATVLVRGSAGDTRSVCESLLGDDAAGRRRLVVETGPGERHPHHHRADDVVRADVATGDVRGAAAVPAAPGSAGADVGSPRDLDALADRVAEGIARLGGDDLRAGELRLCAGDLEPVVAASGAAEVDRFLERVTSRVVEVGGLAHVHLPDGATVGSSLPSQFDVLVELRRQYGGEREQRWELPSSGLRTGWLPLDVE